MPKKKTTLYLPKKMHKFIKIQSTVEDKTMSQLIIESIKEKYPNAENFKLGED